jgi:hypothetical protein
MVERVQDSMSDDSSIRFFALCTLLYGLVQEEKFNFTSCYTRLKNSLNRHVNDYFLSWSIAKNNILKGSVEENNNDVSG